METAPPEELLNKIQDFELEHVNLRDEMPKFILSDGSGTHHRRAPHHHRHRENEWKKGYSLPPHVAGGMAEMWNLSERQSLNVIQSMGQSIYIMDVENRIIFWNRFAEDLYGFSAAEALNKNIFSLIVDHGYVDDGDTIVSRVKMGESWAGQFPVRHKKGHSFLIFFTSTPFYDDDGTLIGFITISSDSKPFMQSKVPVFETEVLEDCQYSNNPKNFVAMKLGLDTEKPLQIAIESKITNLASKVSDKVPSKLKTGENNLVREGGIEDNHYSGYGLSDHSEDINFSGASTPRGDPGGLPHCVFTQFAAGKSTVKIQQDSGDESEGNSAIHKLKSKAEAWIGKKAMRWSLKGYERDTSEARSGQFNWPWNQCEQDSYHLQLALKSESKAGNSNCLAAIEASGSWSSFNISSTSSANSCGSGSSSFLNQLDVDTDCLNYEIMWEDLTILEQIGQGSCGTVYHGFWYGLDVAIKVFSKKEYSEDAIFSFRQEVCLMKGLRHPNILLFMGAVTSPQRLCIITEFIPRGSLFRLLHRSTSKLDWRRKILMALDIARGMNYLHNCRPPIVHRDLKTSNLLVDKNWMVKVADFGLSCVKHATYLGAKSWKGTPQWMAPEFLRNGQSDEKSDIYSFGVILWELATQKIPWEHLNAMQVIGAVGFMNQRLDIPDDVDSRWASIVESCWHSDPQTRPTFQELIEMLKDLQRQYAIQFQVAKATSADLLNEL